MTFALPPAGFWSDLWAWADEQRTLLFGLAIGSAISLVLTALALPIFVGRLPADYFAHRRRERPEWTASYVAVFVVKNLLGLVFLLAGVAMLLLPGQGILTILVGLVLVEFPGKFRLERALVRRQPVFRSLNWLRRRRGAGEFVHPDAAADAAADAGNAAGDRTGA